MKHKSDFIKDGVNDWTHFLDDLHRPSDSETDDEKPSKEQLKILYQDKPRTESELPIIRVKTIYKKKYFFTKNVTFRKIRFEIRTKKSQKLWRAFRTMRRQPLC